MWISRTKMSNIREHTTQKGNFIPDIIYEDNHLLVVNKPGGILSQGDTTGDFSILDMYKSYLKTKYNNPGNVFLGLVHRLDRPVSGVLVLAKTGKALSRLTDQFRKQATEKYYYALVKNLPPQPKQMLEHYLLKNRKQNKSYVTNSSAKGAKQALLEYEIWGSSDNYYMLKIRLLTGRHHQIRCQLAHIGCPVKGDLKYGFPRSNPEGGISLHAGKIIITHPVKKNKMEFVCSLPNEKVWNLFRYLV